jgi:hypothetical protein
VFFPLGAEFEDLRRKNSPPGEGIGRNRLAKVDAVVTIRHDFMLKRYADNTHPSRKDSAPTSSLRSVL